MPSICNVDLVMSERQGIEIDYCPQCRGIWLDRGELDKIIERSQTIAAETYRGRRENTEDSRYYEDKHHKGEHDKYGYKGHKSKSFFQICLTKRGKHLFKTDFDINRFQGLFETEAAARLKKEGYNELPSSKKRSIFVFSGTLVVQGFGITQVQAIGINTEIGKIGTALKMIEPEETLLQKETGKLVQRLAFIGLSLCALVVIAYGITRGNWLNGLLAGITLAMAMLPEEFPVVLTIILASV